MLYTKSEKLIATINYEATLIVKRNIPIISKLSLNKFTTTKLGERSMYNKPCYITKKFTISMHEPFHDIIQIEAKHIGYSLEEAFIQQCLLFPETTVYHIGESNEENILEMQKILEEYGFNGPYALFLSKKSCIDSFRAIQKESFPKIMAIEYSDLIEDEDLLLIEISKKSLGWYDPLNFFDSGFKASFTFPLIKFKTIQGPVIHTTKGHSGIVRGTQPWLPSKSYK